MPEYSVLVPVYNSSDTLRELVEKLVTVMHHYSFEIILVEDGSSDNSWDVMVFLQKQKEYLRIIRHEQNRGQSAALLTGIRYAQGTYLITIDDDLQYDPADIQLLIEEQARSKAELVYGIPLKIYHSPLRLVLSSTVKKLSSLIFKTPSKGSSFRLIVGGALAKFDLNALNNNILPEALFSAFPLSRAYVCVKHFRRKKGGSGYSYAKLLLLLYNSVKYRRCQGN